MSSYRNENGAELEYKCGLADKVIIKDLDGTIRMGKVTALDDDGNITIETATNVEVRTHDDHIICVANDYPDYKKVFGRCWLYEVPFLPNTNWQCSDSYRNDGNDDWVVGEFAEGVLWMNNMIGYVVLVQPNGVCLFDYI